LASDLRRDFPSTSIEVTCDFKDLTTAVFVITATNAPGALVEGMHISSGTIIIDDAQPSDVSPELLKRFDVLVVSAGAVHTPNISTNFPMGLAGRYDNYCCLAEVLILASQGRTKNYVINKPTLEMVDEMSEGGKMLGFRVAEYQNTIGLVDENHIENVLKLAAKRHDKI
jgi:predicted amino acid dehydrogenase